MVPTSLPSIQSRMMLIGFVMMKNSILAPCGDKNAERFGRLLRFHKLK